MSLHVEITQRVRVDDLQSLQNKVRLKGGQLIVYSEVISAILISARSYTVRWVPSPQSRVTAAIPSIIVTSLLGWWTILGPYRVVSALIWNQRGGVDVTESLLKAYPGNPSLLGYNDAIALSTFQENTNKSSRRICMVVVGVLAAVLGYLVWSRPNGK